jgi:hypothetical protein
MGRRKKPPGKPPKKPKTTAGSDTPEWQAIWREELTNCALIEQPGRQQSHEGFAEVGAYLLGHESVPEEVARAMPRAIQFWKDKDLLRGDDDE